MDDGSKVGSGFFLNTQSFTKEECLLLIGVLKENFDLDCTLNINRPEQYRIYIRTRSMNRFKLLVSPPGGKRLVPSHRAPEAYFIPSMMYKLL
jgi:hypothetical protein